MAQSDRRSTPKDSVETGVETDADAGDATVSETGSLSQEPAGDSDAPDDGPHPTADVAATDPRSSATAGAAEDSVPESTESSGSRVAPSTSPKAKTGKSRTGKAETTKAKTGKSKTGKATTTKATTGKATTTKAETATSGEATEKSADKARGKASKSGDPARKKTAAEEKKPASVSRTPVKPKRIANRWAAPMMLACAGIGLAWIVVFYVTQDRIDIPWYSDLGSWNLVVGMGFIVAAFGFSMKWE